VKILHINDNILGGGKEQRMIQLSEGLLSKGIEVEILILEDRIDYKRINETGIKIHCLDGKPKNYLTLTSRLYRKIKEIDPDIVQIWSSLLSASFISVASTLLRKKIIGSYVTVANSIGFFHKHFLLKKIDFMLADKIIANSNAGLRSFKVPQKKGILIYNGFDKSRLNAIKTSEELKLQYNIKESNIVTMVARFDKAKDYNMYLKAAQLICDENKSVAFLCLGKGPMEEEYRQKYKQNKSIYFLGFQENILNFVNASDICVLCSDNRYHLEGVSNSIIESMFLKKPVVATSGGGTDEVIINGNNGFLISPSNHLQLKEKLDYLILNNEERLKLGEEALKFANKKFDLGNKTDEYIKIYNDLLN
jgi:glycosyltransferase involved in cell wall biosynthesis